MENKRHVLSFSTLLFLLLIIGHQQTKAEIPTPASVKSFYDNMQKLSTVTDPNTAYYISKEMNECFYGLNISVSGIPLPNDFRFFDIDKKNISHNDEQLNSATYINRLSDYIYKSRIMRVGCSIQKTELAGDQPDFHKGRLAVSACLVSTYVQKTYKLNGYEKTFNDTVYTDYSNGKISEIRNGNGANVVNINSLRIKAALAYRLGRYYEAYKCYEQIISISSKDGDALYRIGLMTYYQQGCYFSKKSAARKKGLEYMELASRNGDYSIVSKADNVIHNWKYPRI